MRRTHNAEYIPELDTRQPRADTLRTGKVVDKMVAAVRCSGQLDYNLHGDTLGCKPQLNVNSRRLVGSSRT